MKPSRMKLFLRVVIMAVLFLAGGTMQSCRDEDSNSTLPFTEFPLQVGKKWTYLTVFNFKSITASPMETTWEVVRTEMLNGKLNYVIRKFQVQSNGTYKSESYYTNETSGMLRNAGTGSGLLINFKKEEYNISEFSAFLNVEEDTIFMDSLYIFDEPRLNMKYPVILGDEWLYTEHFDSALVFFRKYERIEQVTTPAGTFETVAMTTHSSSPAAFTWEQFFSTKGLIKEVVSGREIDTDGNDWGTFTIVTELTSFN